MSTPSPAIQHVLNDPTFLNLKPEDQVAVLRAMREAPSGREIEAGDVVRLGTAAQPERPMSLGRAAVDVGRKFLKRGKETAKGAWETLTAPPETTTEKVLDPLRGYTSWGKYVSPITSGGLAIKRMGEGLAGAEKELGKQVGEQEARGETLRAHVGAAAQLDPFATGTLAEVNKLIDERRYREALGTGAFDILLLGLGSRLGRKPSTRTQVTKLTAATGETGETVANTSKVLPDIMETARTIGKPSTVGQYATIVQGTLTRLDQQFNTMLYPMRSERVIPSQIARRIRAIANKIPKETPEGRASLRQIEKAARRYEQPRTYGDINLERMQKNAELRSFESKEPGSGARIAAVKSSTDLAIDKAIADGGRDVVYDAMEQRYPGADVRALKGKESALWNLSDHLVTRLGKLEDAQAAHEAVGPAGRTKMHGYISPEGRVHAYMGVFRWFERGPGTIANKAVRQAFGPTGPALARRTAVLSLPIERLGGRSRLAPPPAPEGLRGRKTPFPAQPPEEEE